MTLGDCLERAFKLINYFSAAGERIGAADPTRRDYQHRAIGAIATALGELAGRCPRSGRIIYTQHPLRPLATGTGLLRLSQPLTMEAAGASAFSLLCDGDAEAVLYIKTGDTWETALSVTHEGTGRLETVSGRLSELPEEDAQTRLVVTAPGAYAACVGLYRRFPENEGVPVYSTRRVHPLPDDFGGVVCVRPLSSFRQVYRQGFYVLEEGGIGFPWAFEGTAELIYKARPRPIIETTGMDETLDVQEDVAGALPYRVAAILLADEDEALSARFERMYEERVRELPAGPGGRIRNTLYGGLAL